jgi:hypothetical protein
MFCYEVTIAILQFDKFNKNICMNAMSTYMYVQGSTRQNMLQNMHIQRISPWWSGVLTGASKTELQIRSFTQIPFLFVQLTVNPVAFLRNY